MTWRLILYQDKNKTTLEEAIDPLVKLEHGSVLQCDEFIRLLSGTSDNGRKTNLTAIGKELLWLKTMRSFALGESMLTKVLREQRSGSRVTGSKGAAHRAQQAASASTM